MSALPVLLPLTTFLALAGTVALAGVLPGDSWLREWVLGQVSPAAVEIFRWLNYAGSWQVLGPAAPLLLLFPRLRRQWWLWLAVLVAAPALESMLKPLVGRLRPEGAAFGFPSGHATAAAAYLGAVIVGAGDLRPLARWTLRAGAATVILLVGLARIVLRAHWPSDVLGGIALGLACATGAALISAAIRRSPAGPMFPARPSPGSSWQTPPGPS